MLTPEYSGLGNNFQNWKQRWSHNPSSIHSSRDDSTSIFRSSRPGSNATCQLIFDTWQTSEWSNTQRVFFSLLSCVKMCSILYCYSCESVSLFILLLTFYIVSTTFPFTSLLVHKLIKHQIQYLTRKHSKNRQSGITSQFTTLTMLLNSIMMFSFPHSERDIWFVLSPVLYSHKGRGDYLETLKESSHEHKYKP